MFASPSGAFDESASERSAADLNTQIRALWTRAGATLTPAEQERYRQLLIEWAAAVKAEVVPAA